ncbi:hypothetical protein ABT88_06880 [Salmonella enterica subsp. enterica serovar Typhimurium]|nr:hypothetical protein ABT88_06880 [Salmonella enterica subsp. enterica serovar Typhimurium]
MWKVPVWTDKPAKALWHVEFFHFRNGRSVFVEMTDKHQHPQTDIILQEQSVRIAVRNGFIRRIELPVQIRFRPLLRRTGQQLQMAISA